MRSTANSDCRHYAVCYFRLEQVGPRDRNQGSYLTATSDFVAPSAAPDCALTWATRLSTVRPYLPRRCSTVVACSMKRSGQPIRTTGVFTRCSLNNSSTLEP